MTTVLCTNAASYHLCKKLYKYYKFCLSCVR